MSLCIPHFHGDGKEVSTMKNLSLKSPSKPVPALSDSGQTGLSQHGMTNLPLHEQKMRHLFHRAERGDKSAVDELYDFLKDHYGGWIKRNLKSFGIQHYVDMSDVFQSVILRLMKDQGDHACDPLRLDPYIYTSLNNEIIKHVRTYRAAKRNTEPNPQATGWPEDRDAANVAIDTTTPSQVAAARESLAKILEGASPSSRVLIEAVLEGESNQEIAEKLGKKANTVSRRISRMLGRIGRRMAIPNVLKERRTSRPKR
jgi:RNA polymerase sigma factor (sigma-70 family)